MDTTSSQNLEQFEGSQCEWADIPCHVTSALDWLYDALLFIPRKLYQLLLEGLATTIEAIPVPDFFSQASANLSAIPSSVMWLASYMALPQALAIFVSAYTLRFVIRRLPVVG